MGESEAAKSLGRSPHGERGLKYWENFSCDCRPRRSPHGERGLKFPAAKAGFHDFRSLPPRGAWIEIMSALFSRLPVTVAPPTGSVD